MLTLSDQGVKLLKEVMGRSDTIRYRVFDVIIDGILISDQAFEFAMSAGFIPKILEVRTFVSSHEFNANLSNT